MKTYIPDLLIVRFDKLKNLEQAYDLLDKINKSGISAESEKAFISKRIEDIEQDLLESEQTTIQLINRFQDDPVTWAAARLRFLQGYRWANIASFIGGTEEAIKAKVYRRFQKYNNDSDQ